MAQSEATRLVKILYEDEAAGKPDDFGPHKLVLWLLWDRIKLMRLDATAEEPPNESGDLVEASDELEFIELWQLKGMLRAFPKNGDSKLLRASREDLADLTQDGSRVFAVFDDNHVRELVGLAMKTCLTATKEKILEGCTHAKSLKVVFLKRNMESVLDAACIVLGCSPFTKKPRPNGRDLLLGALTGVAQREQRAEVIRRVPSLGYLVEKVAQELELTKYQRTS